MTEKYLVWSNQHGAWWGPNERGYTTVYEFAGRYTKEQAERIVNKSTLNGTLKHNECNHLTGEYLKVVDEVMVKEVKEADE